MLGPRSGSVGPVPPGVALTIAGSDSGGGAGLQGDLKTFAAWGVFGTCAVTAVTAQNTVGVTGVTAMEPEMVVLQIEAVLSDLRPAAVKTGMLANRAIVEVVAHFAKAGRLENLVVDPVLVSTSGHRLMEEGGIEAYRHLLLPHAAVATPNLREAAVLTGRSLADLSSVEAMAEVAEELRVLGARVVVVKGGHLSAARIEAGLVTPGSADASTEGSPDVVAGPAGLTVLSGERVVTSNDHGTGCSLSAAIAARLAAGADPIDAVTDAKAYVRRALEGASTWRLGAGRGPIDHFGASLPARRAESTAPSP